MFGMKELKNKIIVTEQKVECPVKGCSHFVERQQKYFRAEAEFRCPSHNIYISPSTFEYEHYLDNILWKHKSDIELLKRIETVKRESRIARDNSEDAVTWNVFRFLEKNGLISSYISSITESFSENAEVMYWSYSSFEKSSWSQLNKSRIEFGEVLNRSSEPDVIIKTNKELVFIEAKVTATNETKPSDEKNRKKYLTGGQEWFTRVFRTDYDMVAIFSRKYELMRFWLLGTWLAKQLDLDFYLVNIVLTDRETDIEKKIKMHIVENERNRFIRSTWEDIYTLIKNNLISNTERDIVLHYF